MPCGKSSLSSVFFSERLIDLRIFITEGLTGESTLDHSRRGFRLTQHSHLRTLKNLVSEKLGKRCEKIGEILNKIGKPGNFEEVHFFPVSPPDHSGTDPLLIIYSFI